MYNCESDPNWPLGLFRSYLPQMRKDPEKYIEPNPELRQTLTHLRSHKKFLFIATNSHIEYLNFAMTTTLGEDWLDLFDLCLVNCNKPLFHRVNCPFFQVDETKPDFEGKRMQTHVQMEQRSNGKTYLNGNAEVLANYIQKHVKENAQIAFFSKHYFQDIQGGFEFN
jgi:hypothetical protein